LPFGISLIAPAFHDEMLCALGMRWQGERGPVVGATSVARPVRLAVVGAHLSGQPLNRELVDRQARLVRAGRTAREYRLYALAGTTPPKPGLVRVTDGTGEGIEVEVWELSEAGFGSLVAAVPAPLAIGTVTLADGEPVKGFLCEAHAIQGAEDISAWGGWRAYRAGRGGS
jgi:allophanate hydrolase